MKKKRFLSQTPNFFFFFSIISSSSFLFSHASISLASTKTFYRFTTWEELWQDSKFLYGFFSLFPNQNERAILAQVCQKWREVLYQPVFWRDVRPVIHCRAIRSWSTSVASYCTNTSSSTATSSASNQSITNSSFSNNEIRSTITCEVNSNNTTTNNTTNNAIAATDMQQTTASEAVVTSPASTTGNIDKKYTLVGHYSFLYFLVKIFQIVQWNCIAIFYFSSQNITVQCSFYR